MVKCRDLEKIKRHNKEYTPVRKSNNIKKLYGVDTETINGKCFLLGVYSDDYSNITETPNFNKFLLQLSVLNNNALFLLWNINYDLQAILKLLPDDDIKFFADYDFLDNEQVYIKKFADKSFHITIKFVNKTYKFFDIAQFYNYMKLDNAGEKFLSKKKIDLNDFGIDIINIDKQKYYNDIEYQKNLNKYLLRDCEITYLLGKKLQDMSISELNVFPTSFYSQASLFQQKFLEGLSRTYTLPKKEILQYALNSYQGGRFETVKKGFFSNVKTMDINSAYPEQMARLPSLDTGKWIENKKYEPESLISLYKIKCSYYNKYISPIKYEKSGIGMIYPNVNNHIMYINKKEYEQFSELGVDVKIINAYHYFDNNPEHPFSFISDIYNKRKSLKAKGDTNEHILKICINGGYGKTIQLIPDVYEKDITNMTPEQMQQEINLGDVEHEIKKDNKTFLLLNKGFKSGQLFNPVYANEITANTRVKLLNAIKNNFDSVINFATDSITYQGNNIKLKIGKKLGEWDTEYQGNLLILGSGVYHKYGQDKSKLRGFDSKLNLHNMIQDNLNQSVIRCSLNRLVKLKYINKVKNTPDKWSKNKFDNLNKFMDFEKEININFDKKRMWDKNFKNCKEILNRQILSKPINL